MKESHSRAVAAAIAVLSTLYLIDLFFDWRHVDVGMGMVGVHVSTTGWDGWGWVAGIAAIALLVYTLMEISGYIPPEQGTEIGPAVLAIVLVLSTMAAFHNTANVDVMGAVSVTRETAATLGLVLAGAIAVLGVGRLILAGPAFSGRSHPAH